MEADNTQITAQTKAEARYIRVSPQKARLVVDLIRGRKANASFPFRCCRRCRGPYGHEPTG